MIRRWGAGGQELALHAGFQLMNYRGQRRTEFASTSKVGAGNTPPAISPTNPTPNQNFTAPASVTLTANASDPDNNLASVEFFQNGILIARLLSPPYTTIWNDVAPGGYRLTAVATDATGAQTTSAAVSITVTVAQTSLYFIHSDSLGTPRLVTDSSNHVVWRHLPTSEPFGNGPVEDDPRNTGSHFVFNLRFPGQYADAETKLAYNGFRDYDRGTGRYVQSDPIGLKGGINTYGYVGANPASLSDPLGLDPTLGNADRVAGIPSGRSGDQYSSKYNKCMSDYLRSNYNDFVADALVPNFSALSYIPGSGFTANAWETTVESPAVKGAVGYGAFKAGTAVATSSGATGAVGRGLVTAGPLLAKGVVFFGTGATFFATTAQLMASSACSCNQ